jgi:hypothetical protein
MFWNTPIWSFTKNAPTSFTSTTTTGGDVGPMYYTNLKITFRNYGTQDLFYKSSLGKVKDIDKVDITSVWSDFKKWFHTKPESDYYTLRFDTGETTFKRNDVLYYTIFYSTELESTDAK